MSDIRPRALHPDGHDCVDCDLYGEVLGADGSLEHLLDSSPRTHDYNSGSVLYRAADSVDAVYSIKAGILKMAKNRANR